MEMEDNDFFNGIVDIPDNDTGFFQKKTSKKTKHKAMDYIKECFKYAFFANIIGVFAETFCRIVRNSNCHDTTGELLKAISSMNTLFAILAICLATIAVGRPLFERIMDYYLTQK